MRLVLRSLFLSLLLVCFFVAEPAPLFAAAKNATTTKSGAVSTKKSAKKSAKNRRAKAAVATGDNYKGAILLDMTSGKTVFARRADQKVAPASLTKILSMFVAFDLIKEKKVSLNTLVPVSAKAAATGGSRMGLQRGDRVTLEELLMGMAVASGNDASIAVAEYFGKTEAGFVRLMNKKAQAVGMKNSVFKNANGLPAKGQYTTARDMLTLARKYLTSYPSHLAKYHSFRTYTYNGYTSANANPLLGKFPGADGLKTGYVGASGFNLISTAKRGEKRLLGVLLGAPSRSVRADETVSLLEKGFATVATASSSKQIQGKPSQAQKTPVKKNNKAPKAVSKAPVAKTPPAKVAASSSSPKKNTANKVRQSNTASKSVPNKSIPIKANQPRAEKGKSQTKGV